MHPLAGTWKANLAKSHRHANHQFQSATMTFKIQGQVVVMKHAGVNGLVSLSRFVGTDGLETIGKRGETVLGHGTYAVSDEGQTMTATVRGVDAQGAAFEQVIVFDKI